MISLHSWVEVNGYMDNDYRELVVSIALTQLQKASKELKGKALSVFKANVQLPGFRTGSFPHNMPKFVMPHVLREFKHEPEVAGIVICLWAEAQKSIIDELKQAVIKAGYAIKSDWDWRSAQEGFYNYEDIGDFNRFVETYSIDTKKPESDHFKLATLWLSGCLNIESEPSQREVGRPINEDRIDLTELASTTYPTEESTTIIAPTNPSGEIPDTRIGDEKMINDPKTNQGNSNEGQQDVNGIEINTQQVKKSENLQDAIHAVDNSWEEITKVIQFISEAAQKTNYEMLNQHVKALLNSIEKLSEEHEAGNTLVEKTLSRIITEIQHRPDLTVEMDDFKKETDLKKRLSFLISWTDRIQNYDEQKSLAEQQCQELISERIELEEAIKIWVPDERFSVSSLTNGELHGLTLNEINQHITTERQINVHLQERNKQLREICISHIKAMHENIRELDIEIDPAKSDRLLELDRKLNDFTASQNSELKRIERELEKVLEELIQRVKYSSIATIAAKITDEFTNQDFIDLLEALARQQRDAEAVILFTSNSNSRSSQVTPKFSKTIARSMLNGLGQLSKESNPFELINLIGPELIQNCEVEDPVSQAELGLAIIAARYGGDQQLSTEILWHFPVNFPLEGMPNISKLWQSAWADGPINFIDQTQADLLDHFERARSHAVQLLAREHGKYVRLGSIQSWRHQEMLAELIMPLFSNIFEKFEEQNIVLQKANRNAAFGLVNKLKDLVEAESENLSENYVNELYIKGLYEKKIDDDVPFHKRTSLRVILECSEALINYGNALLAYWEGQIAIENGIVYADLRSELNQIANPSRLLLASVESIRANWKKSLPVYVDEQRKDEANKVLTRELLSQVGFISRMPRLIASLTFNNLSWEKIWCLVLEDLANPMEIEKVASYLLENDAVSHVISLTQYISLDLQKQAQQKKGEKERAVENLNVQLIQLGGNSEDLLFNKKLGRWNYVIHELSDRVNQLLLAQEDKRKMARDFARRLRQEINEIDEQVFENKDSIPVEAFTLIQEALSFARKANDREELQGDLQDFTKEMHYRLEHQSWPISDIGDLVDHLRQKLSGKTQQEHQWSAEEVLERFDKGDLAGLRLSPALISSSEVGTRINLLQNWLLVRGIQSALSHDQSQMEIQRIKNIYRYFAQMMKMKHFLNREGKVMESETPLAYSYWELQIPKTAALDTQCIFITLPGNPPSPSQVEVVKNFLDEKQFLEDYFVFLFVPGCTPKLSQALQSEYRKSGLVIIDESTLLNFVLSEVQDRNPLALLRPIMLNAKGADNVIVFDSEHSVDVRCGIFVGRDALVERIASSGSNYAIYGGRRIGKSSVIMAVMKRLGKRATKVILHDFQGEKDCSDDSTAISIAKKLLLPSVKDAGDFKSAVQSTLDLYPDISLTLILDEIDKYILSNPKRHLLIEAFRALSDQYGSRFQIVVAGFMKLYDCLSGRGPYTHSSDPWGRMFIDKGPMENLRPENAEEIVKEGFTGILGWQFESRAIPQRVVELTGGHPAFVQRFCYEIQDRVGRRGDHLIKVDDVEAIFSDHSPDKSFIAYVRKTLEMNLDPIGRYLLVWLASELEQSKGFTLDQIKEYARLSQTPISEARFERSLERLKVTSVIKETASQVFEFSVPDYPMILNELGETSHLDQLEDELREYLQKKEYLDD